MKKNPFYLKEIPVDAPFCDREKELADLISYAGSNSNVVLYSASYMAQHNLGSTGGIQQSLATLSKQDLIEKNYRTGVWSIVDPIFKNRLIEMSL